VVPVDGKKTTALVRKLLNNVQRLAKEVGDDELAEAFVAGDVVVRTGQRKKFRRNRVTDERTEMLHDVAHSILYESTATVTVMWWAVQTLVHDYSSGKRLDLSSSVSWLPYYIQWPTCASRYRTKEPFKPFFDLWARDVAWRFAKGKVAEVFTP
jgi:hypothetical protein